VPMADAYRSRGSATKRTIVVTILTKARRNAKVSHAQNYARYDKLLYVTAMTSARFIGSSANLRKLSVASNSHMN